MRCDAPARRWLLIGADGSRYESLQRGAWGGHGSTRIYGRLDCATALRALRLGGYISQPLLRNGSFVVSDDAFTAAGGGSTVTMAPGGTVSFSYPSGSTTHNVDFGTGPQPSSCTADGNAQAPRSRARPPRRDGRQSAPSTPRAHIRSTATNTRS